MATKLCEGCGRQMDESEARGLCPACLLRQGVASDTVLPEERKCEGCQHPLDDEARFCARCGSPASAIPQSSEDPLRHALEVKLGGQYRILRLLGRGGMGAVYLARDLTLEREVAIKVVTPAADLHGMVERFRREAKTAAKLSHPNVVPLHAFGEVEGMPYFVMGYVRGESLADRLRRDGKLPEDEARRILSEIADALDHAHRQGVVHRDVKPDNVLLEDATGRAMLTDFGIAKTMNQAESLTHRGAVVGTPHFMSPEQAAGRPDIDGRSDIYSLGVMGYAMLAGRLPFEGHSAGDVLTKHLTQEPPPLRSLAPAISDSTLEAVGRCMEKDPSKRWQDTRALKATLGTTEETSLPDTLESVHGTGVVFVAIAGVFLLLAWIVVIRIQNAPIGVLGIIAAVLLGGYVVVLGSLRFEGFPIGLTQRVIWSEPSWWPTWYPRPLRRRGNVWDRLPRRVRRLRITFPLCLALIVSMTIEPYQGFFVKLSILLATGMVCVVLEFFAERELKQLGVSRGDLGRIALSVPPSRLKFWNQPRIAAILAPASRHDTSRRAESPHDHLQSILHIAGELSGPLRPLGAEAAEAARRLIGSIELSERQIADLARNLEPGEEQRLAEKIEALGTAEESEPMRDLIQKQLELVRGLAARVEAAKESRNRHLEVLKTLALHLTSLRARLADTPSEVRSLSDSVRALCDQIGQQGAGVQAENLPTVEKSVGRSTEASRATSRRF